MTKRVAVIGGGIVGLTIAYYLEKENYNVTVIDKGRFGKACSKGNQGWVCPAIHQPVPAPGLITDAFKMMLKKDSPLYIRPTAIPNIFGWMLQFLKYCNEKEFNKGEKALLTLSQSTLSLFEEMLDDGLDFEVHKEGILFVFLNENNLLNKLKKLEQSATAYDHEVPKRLTAQEVREMVPELSNNVIGGILFTNQYHVRPETFSQALIAYLKSSSVRMIEDSAVIGFESDGDYISALCTKSGKIEADNFVLANGVWAGELGRKLGYTVPMTAGKGYSTTFVSPNVSLNLPLYLGDVSAGMTPFEGALRIGGTMELSGMNTNLDKKRLESIHRTVNKYLRKDLQGESSQEWVGMRPMTPDGLPVIGRIEKYKNLYIASGHNMVGVAMAPITGTIISKLISTGTTKYDITPFDPNRFTERKKTKLVSSN